MSDKEELTPVPIQVTGNLLARAARNGEPDYSLHTTDDPILGVSEEDIRMKLFSRTQAECSHTSDHIAEPRTQGCEECGSTFNLRICTECGHVGCCESQQGHNTKHARASGHQVIKSFPLEPGSFTWCYSCKRYV